MIPAGAVLLVNTYYAPSSILGFLIVFVLVGLLLLAHEFGGTAVALA